MPETPALPASLSARLRLITHINQANIGLIIIYLKTLEDFCFGSPITNEDPSVSMRAFYSDKQRDHLPQYFFAAGERRPTPDVPERISGLLNGLQADSDDLREPDDYGLAYVSRVHSSAYLSFLETAWAEWQTLGKGSDLVTPNVHPRRPNGAYPASIVGRAGYHQYDLACPIASKTWPAVLWNAHTAAAAALHVRDEGAREAYALCRPPGHHAGPDFAGGFCYLNNAAVAAEILRDRFTRVAILDVDVHHGNGTQEIFYDRGDVFFASLHGDPDSYYPFFWGYGSETGRDAGAGANLNLPLKRGTGDRAYLEALEVAAAQIRAFGAEALVVSLGFDSYEKDPLAFLSITTEGFARIAEVIGRLGLPSVLVQEGGYLCEDLGLNLRSFLGAFREVRLAQPVA